MKKLKKKNIIIFKSIISIMSQQSNNTNLLFSNKNQQEENMSNPIEYRLLCSNNFSYLNNDDDLNDDMDIELEYTPEMLELFANVQWMEENPLDYTIEEIEYITNKSYKICPDLLNNEIQLSFLHIIIPKLIDLDLQLQKR